MIKEKAAALPLVQHSPPGVQFLQGAAATLPGGREGGTEEASLTWHSWGGPLLFCSMQVIV